ncbi:hypothetical protein N431DRAFT_492765 [Stipitochalara longipes BDJ]|nr:hypothetical protein N431DRAFT_492765 [Stipitochalara longipes BDJ]
MATISETVLKANEVSSEPTPSLFLTRFPLELRFKVFDELLNTHHIIIISPNGKQRGVLRPLAQVCKEIRGDIQKWLEGKKEACIIRSLTFGVFNNEVTTFKMCWVDNHFCYVSRDNARTGLCTLQRCYHPGHPTRDLKRLEIWQRAIDIGKSNFRPQINSTIYAGVGIEAVGAGLAWREEDWIVLDPKQGRVCTLTDQFVWSHDFATHVEHQEYTRQHPQEKMRVKRVECGLAFEFKLVQVGEDVEYVEVD